MTTETTLTILAATALSAIPSDYMTIGLARKEKKYYPDIKKPSDPRRK